jgi:hypothetical protein
MGTSLEADYSLLRHRVAEELKGVGLRFPPIRAETEKVVPAKPALEQAPAKPPKTSGKPPVAPDKTTQTN